MKPFIYIAGPYRAETINEIAENIAEARRVSAQLWKLGYTVFTPHLNSSFMDGICPDQNFLDGDRDILKALAGTKQGCIMVLCRGWYGSAGTRDEIELAESLSVKVFKSIDLFLKEVMRD